MPGSEPPTANEHLRTARERTASPTRGDECLSRDELADLVVAYVWRQHGKTVVVDGNYIGKLERGVIRWPGALYREAFRAILQATGDADLGFVNPRRKVVRLADMDRQLFLRAAALGVGALTLAPVAALLDGGEPTPMPARVLPEDIDQVRTAARVFATWDHLYGGGLAREAVHAQLRWSVGLLDVSCDTGLRPALFAAIGYLAHTCAFAAFDAYAHVDARRIFRVALGCAEQAGDWHLRAKVLSSMARQAIWTGHPDDGLTLAEHALVRADRLTATEQAMLHTAHARALAKMGRTNETLIAIGTADDRFHDRRPGEDAPFMAYYDAAQHAGDTGHALYDLALGRGRSTTEAVERLAAAVAGHTSGYARSRAISQTKLASLLMATGDPAQAASIGMQALEMAGPIRSRRAADDLRDLARHAGRHRQVAAAAELQHRIGTALLAS